MVDETAQSEPEGVSIDSILNAARRPGVVERRTVYRARALLAGKIIVSDGVMSADCLIRNLSAVGAHVRVSASVELPRAIGLLLIREGVLFDATVVWRNGDKAGLAFTGQHDLGADRDARRRGARALWAELTPR